MTTAAKTLRAAALVLMGFYTALYLLISLNLGSLPDVTGPVIAILVTAGGMVLAWNRPMIAGILLIVWNVLALVWVLWTSRPLEFKTVNWIAIFFYYGLPLLAGLLLLATRLVPPRPSAKVRGPSLNNR